MAMLRLMAVQHRRLVGWLSPSNQHQAFRRLRTLVCAHCHSEGKVASAPSARRLVPTGQFGRCTFSTLSAFHRASAQRMLPRCQDDKNPPPSVSMEIQHLWMCHIAGETGTANCNASRVSSCPRIAQSSPHRGAKVSSCILRAPRQNLFELRSEMLLEVPFDRPL